MGMANLNRLVAEVLMRAHQEEHGPAGSDPVLSEGLTSDAINEQMVEMQMPLGTDTVMSILRDLADQDYITLERNTREDPVLVVKKVYPARLKRDFNLWHLAEEM